MIKLIYDDLIDVLYVRFRDRGISRSEEIAQGITVDCDEAGEVVGIEVMGFSKRRIDLNELITSDPESIVKKLRG